MEQSGAEWSRVEQSGAEWSKKIRDGWSEKRGAEIEDQSNKSKAELE